MFSSAVPAQTILEGRATRAWREHAPLWLWPNLLSLDAPVVAVLWSLLFLRASHVAAHQAVLATLFLAVWAIYLGDRLLDAFREKNSALRERHFFSRRHVSVLVWLVAGVCAAAAWLVFGELDVHAVRGGLVLGAALVAYLFLVHAGGTRTRATFPKEIAVGAIFAAGTALPSWSEASHFPIGLAVAAALFAALCALNCFAIECWETESRRGERIGVLAIALAGAASAVLFLPRAPVPAAPLCAGIASAALLLFAVHAVRERLSPAALRVLADVALAVPPLVFLVGAGR